MDLETTGAHRDCDIYDFAASMVFSPNSKFTVSTLSLLNIPIFNSKIKTEEITVSVPISEHKGNIIGLNRTDSQDNLMDFTSAWSNFMKWFRQGMETIYTISNLLNRMTVNVVLTSHNLFTFDLPVLYNSMRRYGIHLNPIEYFKTEMNITHALDTRYLFKRIYPDLKKHRLATVYRHVFNSPLKNAHTAKGDVVGLGSVLKYLSSLEANTEPRGDLGETKTALIASQHRPLQVDSSTATGTKTCKRCKSVYSTYFKRYSHPCYKKGT